MQYGGNALSVKSVMSGHLKAPQPSTQGSRTHLDHSNLELIDRNGGWISRNPDHSLRVCHSAGHLRWNGLLWKTHKISVERLHRSIFVHADRCKQRQASIDETLASNKLYTGLDEKTENNGYFQMNIKHSEYPERPWHMTKLIAILKKVNSQHITLQRQVRAHALTT